MNRILMLSLFVALCQLGPVHAQVTVVVVQEGDAAPDGNGSFSGFDADTRPALNDMGQVAFRADLTGTSGEDSDESGIFRGDGAGKLTQIALLGQAASDGNGAFKFFLNPVLNNVGQVAFYAQLSDPSGDGGIFRGDGVTGSMQIARKGQAAPDGISTFSNFSHFPTLNDAGQVAFLAVMTGRQQGIFRGDGMNGLTQIARAGQAAPDGDGRFSFFGLPALNDTGETAFSAELIGTSNGFTSTGIFRGDGVAGPTRIARSGQAAPDGNSTFTYSSSNFGSPALNDAGQTAFHAALTGTNGGSSEKSGIFRDDRASGLTQIARSDQAAIDGNGIFSRLGNPALNDTGQTAFFAHLTGTGGESSDSSGIFRGDRASGLMQIAREGQLAPDGNGTFATFSVNGFPVLNDAGQVAFRADLTGTSGGSSDAEGIYFHDDALGLLKVARMGDVLLGSTITSLGFSSRLNELGQVAYSFQLADGNSGIAIWTVPEPCSAALLSLGGLTLLRRRSFFRSPKKKS